MSDQPKAQRPGRPRKENPLNYTMSVNLTKEEYDAIWRHISQSKISSASNLFRQLLNKAGIINN